MLKAEFRALESWPGARTQSRKEGTFRSTWLQTLDLLEVELGKIRAQRVVIQIEDPGAIEGIRNDHTIRIVSKNFWPDKACVVLSFDSPKGAISMPCDRYRYWQDNLRAIALSLEALRAVDRYGVTRGNEQYRGWARLESGNGNGMDRDKALAFLSVLSGVNSEKLARYLPDDLATLIRAQRIHNHPDRASDDADRARRAELSAKLGQAEHALYPPQRTSESGQRGQ
jgi:hypothetical protein